MVPTEGMKADGAVWLLPCLLMPFQASFCCELLSERLSFAIDLVELDIVGCFDRAVLLAAEAAPMPAASAIEAITGNRSRFMVGISKRESPH
jgi:hypothetical protein